MKYLHTATAFLFGKSIVTALLCMLAAGSYCPLAAQKYTGHIYYLNNAGNDTNNGNRKHPWKTIAKLNSTRLLPGDRVYFFGGQVFDGMILLDTADRGSRGLPVKISSYGSGKAIINGGDSSALRAYHTAFISLGQLRFTGTGRKTGNTSDGVVISQCAYITLDNIAVTGFQKSGLLIHASSNIEVKSVVATDNGFAGIYAVGEWNNRNCSNIHISHCRAENNPGDPGNLSNHSGNGILAGYCKNILIEYCSAGNNGWDMPRKGNGPVGIWCFEADSVIIQHCISYKNKTAPGAADGGGFDLDGGVTNSIIQYCLSYSNQGSGYGLFQYAGASPWKNNTIRYCISENDGNVSAAHAGVFVWNSSGDSSQLANCFFYNNTIYNAGGAAVSYEALSAHSEFYFFNNLFVAKDSLVTGRFPNSIFQGNNWYSLSGRFIMPGVGQFQDWSQGKGLTDLNITPHFFQAGNASITNPDLLPAFNHYYLAEETVLPHAGINLKQSFNINNGGRTFNGAAAKQKGIGACL